MAAALTRAPDALRPYLRLMLEDLMSNRLSVCLVPSQEPDCALRGGKIRCVEGRNPDWYRDHCAAHPSARRERFGSRGRERTRIKRLDTLRVLRLLADGVGSVSGYAPELVAVADQFQHRAEALGMERPVLFGAQEALHYASFEEVG